MTQDGVVTKLLPNNMAEVAVARTTACGGNCPSCESCIFQSEIKTMARNAIQARPGQRVVIATRSRDIFGAAALVYLVPIVLMLLSYALTAALGGSEGLGVLVSFLALLLSAGLLALREKKRKNKDRFQFEIVRFSEDV